MSRNGELRQSNGRRFRHMKSIRKSRFARQLSTWLRPRQLTVERLEDRRLLSATAFDDDGSDYDQYTAGLALHDMLLAEGAVEVNWQGVDTYTMPGQWIAQFDGIVGSPTEQVETIQSLLDSAETAAFGGAASSDIQFEVTEHLGANGLVLVEAPADVGLDSYEPLMAMAGIEYAEPNFVDVQQASTFPNDLSYCNLSCLLPWQVRGVSDDCPTGARRIDWALNLAGKRMSGLMRNPTVETTCPRDSLSDRSG